MTNFQLVLVAFMFALVPLFGGSDAAGQEDTVQTEGCDHDLPECVNAASSSNFITITNECAFDVTLALFLIDLSGPESVPVSKTVFEVESDDTMTQSAPYELAGTLYETDLMCCVDEGSQCSSD